MDYNRNGGAAPVAPLVLATIICFILQVAFASHIGLAEAHPNFCLASVALIAFIYGSKRGCTFGFIFGILCDLGGQGPFGLWALVFSIAGFVLGISNRNVLSEGWRTPMLFFSITALVVESTYGIFLGAFGYAVSFGASIFYRILPSTLLDMVVMGIILIIFVRTSAGGRNFSSSGTRYR